MKNKFLINPFAIYGLAFSIVVLLYSFGWSELYPALSASLLMFLLTTVVIMFGIGFRFYRNNYFEYSNVDIKVSKIGWQITICYLLLILEFVAARNIPLLSMIRGDSVDYTEFGLPFVHIIFVAWISVLSIYLFHGLLSTPKGKRIKIIIYQFLIILSGILIINRAMIMIILIAWAVVYLMKVKSITKIFSRFLLVALSVLYLFGLMGNYRTSGRSDSEAIMSIGEASADFKDNIVPGEFFWSYIYIVSPIGNLQYNINKSGQTGGVEDSDVNKLLVFEMMPEMVSKRLAANVDMERESVKLANPLLNAYSVYSAAYTYAGWWGMWLMFIFTLFFVFVNLILVPKTSPYFVTSVALISTIMLLNIFNNFFSFMNIVSQLLLVNILSVPYFVQSLKKAKR